MFANRALFKDMRSVAGLLAICAMGHLGANVSLSQQQDKQPSWNQQIQEAYTKHDAKIRHLLPPYSGPPLLLDLFHRRLEDGMCDPGKHVTWETYFNGVMSGHTIIADLGFSKPVESTATTLVTIDTFAPIYSLPAKRSFAVVLAKPISGRVCIPRSRRYVYTKFTLKVLKEFRKGKNSESQSPQEGGTITAAEFGGTVRFPSGYLETFLWSQEGFVEVGKRYILFMWKPISTDDMLVISQAYLIQDGLVFPVSSNGDAQTVYTKMPFSQFEPKVEAAAKKNIDADIISAPKPGTR